jgi:hypothetical protein
MRGWQGQPRKMVEYEHWRKKKRKGRSLGCGLQFGGAAKWPARNQAAKSNNTF